MTHATADHSTTTLFTPGWPQPASCVCCDSTHTGYDNPDRTLTETNELSDSLVWTWDAMGNLTSATDRNGRVRSFSYDHLNRLTSVTHRTSTGTKISGVSYTYDVFDRRIARSVDDDGDGTVDFSQKFVYDGIGPANIFFTLDSSDDIDTRYLYGPAMDQPLAQEQSSGDVVWLLADHLGTIRDLITYDSGTDTTSVLNHITYTVFGTIEGQTSSTDTPLHAFTGREWDAEAGLYYYRARWYDATTGRFV